MFLAEQSHTQGEAVEPSEVILRMRAVPDYRVVIRGYLTECSTMPRLDDDRRESGKVFSRTSFGL